MVSRRGKETKFSKFVDESIYVIAFIGPLITVPQLLQIWMEKSATGVSIVTWCGLLIYDIFWIVYSVVHKDKPLLLTKSLFVAIEIPVILGIILYS